MNKDKPKPMDFVEMKEAAIKLRKNKKDWERKIEIAELEASKARAIIKKSEQDMEGYAYEQ
jgi:hypothetical protein